LHLLGFAHLQVFLYFPSFCVLFVCVLFSHDLFFFVSVLVVMGWNADG
jgi:hypothetical protein